MNITGIRRKFIYDDILDIYIERHLFTTYNNLEALSYFLRIRAHWVAYICGTFTHM